LLDLASQRAIELPQDDANAGIQIARFERDLQV
jgi:hypothetical protein